MTSINSTPTAVILLAGLGSRLGRPHPKPLTKLNDGQSILSRQVAILRSFNLKIIGVVGFKLAQVMEEEPSLLFSYNPNFDTTNTSKSLLCALQNIHDTDVIWLNGDVVFEPDVIEKMLAIGGNLIAGNHEEVGEEEVKYTLNKHREVTALSKEVTGAVGEAVGINMVSADTLEAFKEALAEVDEQDYFERAIELMIQRNQAAFRAVDISEWKCLEVDFADDLEAANRLFS